MLGRRIGSWILEKELGRGGMGSVFEARHATLHTRAAVKVLSAGLESEESFRERFRREAELQAQLRHSNVAHVLDYLEDGGRWFLVLEFLDRGSLAELLARGEKVTPRQAVTFVQQALAGLAHAHQKGIVHRDIKPANLMFSGSGEVVVVDFGIARAEKTSALTSTGMTIGTPHYMSPEQIVTPSRVDGRSDIYSLGVVLFELLAGRKPFDSDSEFSLLQAHVSEPPPPLRSVNPRIAPELEAVVMRALAKNPADRYPDCQSMSRSLALAIGESAVRTVDLAAPLPMPSGGTVMQSQLYERVAPPNPTDPSSSDVHARRRRSFQRRLAAGTVAVLLVATLLAFQQTDWQLGPKETTGTRETTATDTTNTSSTTDGATSPRPNPGEPSGTVIDVTTAGKPKIDPSRVDASHAGRPERDGLPVVEQSMVDRRGGGAPVADTATSPPVSLPSRPSQAAVPVLPEEPQLAVIGSGEDPEFAASLEQELERRLETFRVVDERGDPDVDALLGRGTVSPKELGAQLLAGGFHVLVLVRVEKGEERTFRIQGQSASAKTARLRLNAYLLPTNRMLGSGWTELVEYTELSVSVKARQSFIGATADLREAIRTGWTVLRQEAARRHESGGAS